MLTKLFSIAGNTFTETIRQPIYGVVLMVTAGLLVLNLALSAFTLEDDNKLLKDLGLSTLLLSGLFLAALSATSVLSREIENRTAVTVISKPVARPLFILGKFVGLAAALAVGFYLCSLVFLLTVRHRVMQTATDPVDMPVIVFGIGSVVAALLIGAFCNYFYGMQFGSTMVALLLPLMSAAMALICLIDKDWRIQQFGKDFLDGQIVAATALILLAVMVLAAVAVAASTRLGPVLTLVVCTVVLLIGLVSDSVFGRWQEQSETFWVARAAYRAVPNIGFFWIADALTAEYAVGAGYVGLACLYALLYVAALLLIAMALFQKRELG